MKKLIITLGIVLLHSTYVAADDAPTQKTDDYSNILLSQPLSVSKKIKELYGVKLFKVIDPLEFPKPKDATKLTKEQATKKAYDDKCSVSGKTFAKLQIRMESKYQNRDFFEIMTAEDKALFLDTSFLYESACMESVSKLPTEMVRVLDIVGVVTNDMTPFCTAFRINMDTVVTSRHCFFSEEDNSPSRSKFIKEGKISFIPASGKINPTKVVALDDGKYYRENLENADKINPRNDYVLLKLEAQYSPFPEIKTRDAVPYEDVVLLGYFPFSKEILRGKPSYDDYIKDLQSHLKLTKSSGCYVYAVAASCIYYGCQAQPGFSGAPVLAVTPNSDIVIVGIHTSDVLSTENVCPRKSDGYGNLGISLADEIIALANNKKGGK